MLAKDPNMTQVHYNLKLLYLFATSLPSMTPKQQAEKAITELEKYKELAPRGKGGPDDTDELITRAKTKKAVIEAEKSAPPPTAPAAAPTKGATGTAPTGGAGTKPAAPSGGGSTKSLPPPEEKKK
jgi:hypothetical protein